ncbi:hypothetical protein [Mycobacterium kubicae]|uniref:Uncharacterized protein n=1 Tax=Mycobacterium kubicae TaxID=120959 RepID=A0AAX1J2R6_9MYCO|nr:hypothetical protein [Mycobacterium kubicae]MCV7096077.1 hypothetical protein [Mycobacterium kubicae]ORV99420.1 hypothetical protein AWC13_10850 [Mycobacterium kubicae]QNI12234.1 hypothetical protein GAN18_14345 [Mycobacterium kubicae]QPI35749.1 hypothetical protein I2456_14140 [Mycobacterium kubicae]
MTAVAVFLALVAALGTGYHAGRRAASTPRSWKRRTSRMALGRQALTLVGLVAARRCLQTLQRKPPGLLRGVAVRNRFG